ncbi:MAG: zinc ABC transporter substrate-binding protein [Rubrivivax sp.]|nr:zinc ABC transporter substrate-binding protein [Rubrivivax sp.]
MKISRRSAVLSLCGSLLAALNVPASAQPARPLRVVASFSILADMLRQIGGADVEVSALAGPDADAHVFEPRPADARRLAEADLVVVNGLGFEGWMDRLVRSSGYRGPVVVASQGVVPLRMGGAPDPHAWQDLGHAQRYVQTLSEALVRLRPAQAAPFQARAARYIEKLAALDAEVRRSLASVPVERRRVITAHAAFGYFSAAYGVEFVAAQGRNTDSEPSAADVARLIDQIRARRVTAVFVENITDPRLVERIAREGKATVGGRLYSDALSPPGTEADTYLKFFAHNARAIVAALTPAATR